MSEETFIPRPGQAEVLAYTGGKMGVSAVPGSGKTETLSRLAAKLVTEALLDEDAALTAGLEAGAREVLVVTLVNSAVDNFAGRLARLVTQRGLLPNFGYRVRTLHGLAHDIVKERPDLVQLANDFQIVDEREADRILRGAADAWAQSHPDVADDFLDPELDARKADRIRREQWPALAVRVASSFIKQAKDKQLTPDAIRAMLDRYPGGALPLAEMGGQIYEDYQRALRYRGAVDFDDLIALALAAIKLDPGLRDRLHARWPYILEDEAQDSSRLQEEILRRLAGDAGNWVRVGDPNQAIYETFTTATPKFLRDFLREPGTQAVDLPHSGRSTQSIMNLANHLIEWTRTQHPVEAARDALQPPMVRPAPDGSNPPDAPDEVHIYGPRLTPDEELNSVVRSLERWLPDHPGETVAVLVPRNQRGFKLAEWLKSRELPYVEMLRSTSATREAAGVLANVIRYLATPNDSARLATVYKVWRRDDRRDEDALPRLEAVMKALRKCARVEDFLWPQPFQDWWDALALDIDALGLRDHLEVFRTIVRRWQDATILPIDQLILTVAQDLFDSAADLALAYSMAVFVARAAEQNPHWQLPELAEELAVIARNERKWRGFTEDETGFDPDAHAGEVVVSTMHGAKGLEWDRVYLMSVNNYNFPAAQAHDAYIAERWFIRGAREVEHLNLQAEALAQLDALDGGGFYEEGRATLDDRLEYVRERLRLFYVGITRARKALVVTWNGGRRGDLQPAVPFIELETNLEDILHGGAP